MKKKALILVLVLLLAGAAYLLLGKRQGSKLVSDGEKQQEEQLTKPVPSDKVEITTVPATQLPDNFPKGLPLESGAKVVQNYNATSEDGSLQATRMFETKRTLAENFKLYSDYLTKDGWKIVTSVNQETLKSLGATKDNQHLQITMSENSVTKIRTVDISYTQPK